MSAHQLNIMNSISSAYIANVYGANNNSGSATSTSGTASDSQPFFNTQKSQEHTKDKVTFSPQAQSINRNSTESTKAVQDQSNTPQAAQEGNSSSEKSVPSSKTGNLDAQQIKELDKLQSRDLEVRQHEHAHLAVAGQYASGGASFTYQKGPDGTKYAVGGEVPIDISKESSPEATILKMQVIKRAALAPASPSSADRMIASQADAKAAQARQEVSAQQNKDTQGMLSAENTPSSPTSPNIVINDGKELSPVISSSEDSTRTSLMIDTYKSIASMAN